MRFIVSGEGSSDVMGDETRQGPMRILLDVLSGQTLDVMPVSQKSEHYIRLRKSISMVWKGPEGKAKSIGWYYDVRTLAQYAKKHHKYPYGLVWFHDCDDNDHAEMYKAACAGFETEKVKDYGVPMLPKPCSEAWLLAYFQDDAKTAPYTDCARFERLDGTSKKAPNSPKNVLARRCGYGDYNDMDKFWKEYGYDVVKKIDWQCVNMPSFNHFKNDFLTVVHKLWALESGLGH